MKQTFFIQVLPGLEELAQKEIDLKWPSIHPQYPIPTFIKVIGGLECELLLEQGLSLNYWLKIPNRILLRIDHFKCRDFPKLYNKIKKIDWSPYYAGQEVTIHASSSQSKLIHTNRIEDTLRDGLSTFIKAQTPGTKSQEIVQAHKNWNFFIRLEKDWCTLSIDTSGDRLGIRGHKIAVGKAPIRENIGAALYLASTLNWPTQRERPSLIFDPFCGSGTLLWESFLFYEPNIYRNFSFEFFPKRKEMYRQLKRPMLINLHEETKLVGIDKDKFQLKEAIKNKENLPPIPVELHHQNCLDKLESLSQETQGKKSNVDLLISNLPYGKRIKAETGEGPNMWIKKLISHYQPFRIGLLLDNENKAIEQVTLPESYALLKKYPFKNGGHPVVFCLWENKQV
jgi:putative N6-adenine-specific DNA methylase